MEPAQTPHDHFKGKDALHHIAEVQASGIIASSEIHGAETPGSLFAASDAAKESAVVLVITFLSLYLFDFTRDQVWTFALSFFSAYLVWKFARSTLLAANRLQRFHRIAKEEQHEIDTNREQEREELRALYGAKGFQGKLLEDVVDVLMADQDRLLRVMLEEEMGFRLEENEHPLIQGLGAFFGAVLSGVGVICAWCYLGITGLVGSALLFVALGTYFPARYEKNECLRAVVWACFSALFSFATAYYVMQYLWQ